MVRWLCGHPWRLPLALACYFVLHVLVRSFVSGALDYDESEQAFLSQFMAFGYNSQPPLYTWLQRGTFELFGYSVMSLALLKNLFIWLTYVLVFELIRQATGKTALGLVATLGMLTIPQVAWESHRDLSHTVATMFATSLLIYCVVMMGKQSGHVKTRWYLLLGLAVGVGALFKYNFSIVVVATLAASLTVPVFRTAVMDRRLSLSVLIAAALVFPHVWWMLDHFALASTKTMNALTDGRTDSWGMNAGRGVVSIAASFLACAAGPFFLFVFGFGARLFRKLTTEQDDHLSPLGVSTRYLLERFLGVVVLILVAMTLTGRAVDFENRWFQPFIFLVPAWLTLVFSTLVLNDERFHRNVTRTCAVIMLVILFAVVIRPLSASYRGKYTRLNLPYPGAASAMVERDQEVPRFIFAHDMRDAGNLRLRFPEAVVLCAETPHLITDELKAQYELAEHLWGFSSVDSYGDWNYFAERIINDLRYSLTSEVSAQELSVPYLYGSKNDRKTFLFAEINTVRSGSIDANRPSISTASVRKKRGQDPF